MNEREIYAGALTRESPAERAAFLKEACGSDAALRDRIEALLAEQEKLGSFLESPPAVVADHRMATQAYEASDPVGTQVGPYKLLQQIGEGGMGTVYMAEQTEPVRRKVALKIIKPGMDSRQIIARFEAERQALSLMDHPNIARVLDAGTIGGNPKYEARNTKQIESNKSKSQNGPGDAVSDIGNSDLDLVSDFGFRRSDFSSPGRPYFVMELVRGLPITEYCDQHHLTPRQRLELLLPVCHAIQHAHQKGIIHRDVKPSNILVAEYDHQAVPKVIDFGVAKAMSQPLTEKTMFTGFGQIVGTLEYMSPEQAKVNQLDIDTRSDIYSLGVLMYELLTGSTPFDKKRLRSAAWDEMLRIIREEDPPKPSTRLSDSKDSLPSVSAQRQMEPAKLTKLVQGELDWIVMKALDKDRGRRYETATGLADDIRRYLDDEPVAACPPSAAYRLHKLASKHRIAFATTSLVAVALIVGILGTTWQAIRATRAEQVAEDLLVSEKAAHEEAHRAAVEARQARDKEAGERRAAEAARAEEAKQRRGAELAREEEAKQRRLAVEAQKAAEAARVEAQAVSSFLVSAFRTPDPENAGISVTVAQVLRSAMEEINAEKNKNIAPRVRAALLEAVGQSFCSLGLHDLGVENLQGAVALRKSLGGPVDPQFDSAELALALALRNGRLFDKAIAIFSERVQRLRNNGGKSTDLLAQELNQLGMVYDNAGRQEQAISQYQEAVRLCEGAPASRRSEPKAASFELSLKHNLALASRSAGRASEAISQLEELLPQYRKVLGADAADTLVAQQNLAGLHADARQYDRALQLRQDVYERQKTKLGAQHPQSAEALFRVGVTHGQKKDFAKALTMMEESLGNLEARRGPDHPSLVWFQQALGETLLDAGQTDRGLKAKRRALSIAQTSFGPGHSVTLTAMEILASSLEQTDQRAEAVSLRATVRTRREEASRAVAGKTATTAAPQRRSPQEARMLAETAVEIRRAAEGPDGPGTLQAMATLAEACRARAEFDKAIALYRQIIEAHTRARGVVHGETTAAEASLADTLLQAQKLDEAGALLDSMVRKYEKELPEGSPRLTEARRRLAQVFQQRGEYAEALDLLVKSHRKCVEKQRADHAERQIRADLARVSHFAYPFFAQETNTDSAARVKLAQEVADVLSDSAVGWRNLALARFRAGDWNGAVQAWEKVEANPQELSDAVGHFWKAMACWHAGDQAAARRHYLNGLAWMAERERVKEAPEVRDKAEALMGINPAQRHALVLEHLEARIKQSPLAAHLYRRRAGVHRSLGAREQETVDLEAAVRLDANNDDAWIALAVARLHLGRLEQAKAAAARYVAILGEGNSRHVHSSRLYRQQRMIDAIWRATLARRGNAPPDPAEVDLVENLLGLNPQTTDPENLYQHVAWLVRAGHRERHQRSARALLERVRPADNRRWDYLATRAAALAPWYEDAKTCCDVAQGTLSLWAGWSMNNVALNQFRAGRFDEARAMFHQALAIRGSEGTLTYVALEWTGLALLDHKTGRLDDARRWLAKAEASIAMQPRQLTNESGLHPHDRIALEVLFDEAKRTIPAATPDPKPAAAVASATSPPPGEQPAPKPTPK